MTPDASSSNGEDTTITLSRIGRSATDPLNRKQSLAISQAEKFAVVPLVAEEEEEYNASKNPHQLISRLEKQMFAAAKNLEFEKAAELRDKIKRLREKELMIPA